MNKRTGVITTGAVLAVIVLILSLIIVSLKKLNSSEVAIQYNNFYKTLKDDPYYEGLYLGPPGYGFIKFSSVFQTMSYPATTCLNKDGVTIRINVSFQYRVRPGDLKYITEQFKDETGYTRVLHSTGSSAIHDSCSRFNTSQFQAERGRFQEDLTSRLVDKFENLNCDVTDLQVNNIARPRAYENAIKAKESAREDIEVARNERPQRLTEAQTIKLEAETEADIILNEAKSEARIILTRAQSDSKAILDEYEKEADSYKQLKDANSLDNQGFLAYMGIRAISNAKNPVHIGMKAPARSSYA
ncbi:hypothetical protein LSH36_107g08005 [Paralvinella palmiformis]|uniref:Band 7 domain-containing protein n=1 Tax=Paralvinella palmiformis TaxID=53620 RepID=A0AAD9JZ78_9ANNE|nr:hypothetical protein LSH36_107g08005 [Paralvinella palmiformis]